jgi:P27 family predicted phage terminase small subunit
LLKLAEGNPGHRPINKGPQFQAGTPSPPKWLQGEGRKLWKKLVPELEEQGLLVRVYGPVFEALCFSYGRAIEAEKVLLEKGTTFETEKGYICQRPEVAIAQRAWHSVSRFSAEFGLSPLTAQRIIVPRPKRSLRERLLEDCSPPRRRPSPRPDKDEEEPQGTPA